MRAVITKEKARIVDEKEKEITTIEEYKIVKKGKFEEEIEELTTHHDIDYNDLREYGVDIGEAGITGVKTQELITALQERQEIYDEDHEKIIRKLDNYKEYYIHLQKPSKVLKEKIEM